MLNHLLDWRSGMGRVFLPGLKGAAGCAILVTSLMAGQNVAEASSPANANNNPATSHPANLYVSPHGSENNSGLTPDHPLGSIREAQSVVRKWISRGVHREIVVYLEDGTYRIASPLRFGPRDSGTQGQEVIWRNYPGASPVLDGGRLITGWSKGQKGVWRASAQGRDFLQLYGPNGRISPARTPVFRGRLYSVPGSDTVQVKVPNDFLVNWNIKPLAGTQIVVQVTWRQLRYRIASISPDENGYRWIVAKKPDGTVSPNAGKGFKCCAAGGTNPIAETRHPISYGRSPVYMEYAKQFMTPDSFWLSPTADEVQWIPPAGANPNNVRVTAPTTKTLLTIDGASNLTFYGIQFAYTTWLRPAKDGNMERQGGFRAEPQAAGFSASGWPIWYVNPGAVTIKNSSRILFQRDAFRDLGANGIVLGAATRDITIADSIFRSISDTAIFVGATQDPTLPVSKQNIDTKIVDNVFDNMGVDYAGGTAITGTYPNGLFIKHNLIENVANIGINLGYIDNLPPAMVTSMRNVQITDNRINRTCTVAADCGAIHTKTNFYYSTSKGHAVPKSTIRGNYITNVHLDPYHIGAPPVKAIYLDNHTNGLLVTKNEWKNVDRAWHQPGHGHSVFVDNETGNQRVIRHAGLLPSEKSLVTLDLYTMSIGGDQGPGRNASAMDTAGSDRAGNLNKSDGGGE